jgi:hypothetical protein
MKTSHHACPRFNNPLQPPSRPWLGVTIHFITGLPESTAPKYTAILVLVNRLPKMVTYLICRKDNNSQQLTEVLFEYLICKHGVPDNIVTDH